MYNYDRQKASKLQQKKEIILFKVAHDLLMGIKARIESLHKH